MVRVKICGVTTLDDALVAARAGADMIGLNFYEKSPRSITPENARELADNLRDILGDTCPLLIGVFVNADSDRITAIIEQVGLDAAQLSGDESTEALRRLRGIAFKAIRPRDHAEALDNATTFLRGAADHENLPTLLLDAYHPNLYGGTGEAASVEVAVAVRELTPRLMLAGGLTPENVAECVLASHPWGVDVASGVEVDGQPGRKDVAKVRAFIGAVRQVSVRSVHE